MKDSHSRRRFLQTAGGALAASAWLSSSRGHSGEGKGGAAQAQMGTNLDEIVHSLYDRIVQCQVL